MKHFFRFCCTLEVLHFPLLLWTSYVAYQTYHPLLSISGFFLGFLAYYLLEVSFHRGMHENPYSPFYGPHQYHHTHPSPETGVPRWWTFGTYGIITLMIAFAFRPLIASTWLAILIMLTTYEWIHFLCHCNYRPRTKWGWRVRINHLQHHNLNSLSRYELLFLKDNREKQEAAQ